MAIVVESRPGEAALLHLGGNYAQPSSSDAANPEGCASRTWAWAGDRNSGQPVYGIGDHHLGDQVDRLRKLVGDVVNSWNTGGAEAVNPKFRTRATDSEKDKYFMQLVGLAFGA